MILTPTAEITRPLVAFRVSVWHPHIRPESRDSSTLSDGAIFRNPADADQYRRDVVRKGGKVSSVSRINDPEFWYESLDEFYRVGSMSLAELEHIKNRCNLP